MDIYDILLNYFVEWKGFHKKIAEKLKTRILCSITFFSRKSCLLWDNVEKCGTARQATENDIITKATNT